MSELFVDNFAGGGGASTGIEMAIGRSVDIAINHDPDAIAMHKINHPHTKHYCEDVWQVDPVEACSGKPVALAWFSPDCKHFSRAKGGKPVDKNIRGLAWVAIKWALMVKPRVIMLENVPEIQTWGPLDKDSKPIKARSGETFEGFIGALSSGIDKASPTFAEMCTALEIDPKSEMADVLSRGLGYKVEHRILKSCDYGAPTTRTRFYMIARSDGKSIVWPQATHAPKDSEEVRQGYKSPYHTAAECIDWTIPAQSIFERKKPLAENTLRRIARGIQKFVIENPEPFIVPIGYGEREGQAPRVNSIEEPLGTVVSSGKHYLVAPSLIQYHSETAKDEVRGQELSEPIMTLDTSNRYALNCAYIMKNYAGGYTGAGSNVKKPLGTVTAKDHNSLVTAHIMTLRNNMDGQKADEPLSTISCSGAHHAEVLAFLVKYFSTGAAKPVDEPLDTVTTKDRFAVITVHGEDYIITDIKMRMLLPRELFNAQGFPADYIIDRDADGNPYPKSKQVARCGNAVTPPVPAALVRVNLPEYCEGEDRGNAI
jgi:DNA (cytosine-5)-methyltransferase 1